MLVPFPPALCLIGLSVGRLVAPLPPNLPASCCAPIASPARRGRRAAHSPCPSSTARSSRSTWPRGWRGAARRGGQRHRSRLESEHGGEGRMCAEAVCVSDASSIAPHELRTQYSAEHQRQRCRRDARPCWESGEGPCHGWGPTVPFVPVTPPATAREAEALGVLVFTTTLSQREAARGAFITAAGGPRPWHTHVSRLSRAPARARVPALGRPVRILPGLACFPPPCLSCCRGAGGRWSLQAARLWGAALPLALVAPVVCRPGHVRHGGALCVAGRSKLWLARERSSNARNAT